ncbi:hypothetical protein K502DRAFT_323824 [Neoconidiobolus thromboides FSU 785]|nr:hypothetical protein K502DRAFT_323824 [Neoconidiobolus thromboides FSU 785]
MYPKIGLSLSKSLRIKFWEIVLKLTDEEIFIASDFEVSAKKDVRESHQQSTPTLVNNESMISPSTNLDGINNKNRHRDQSNTDETQNDNQVIDLSQITVINLF